jgi:formate dehydrogenase iron-sulfur subunit
VRSNSFYGPLDPAPDAGWQDAPARKGFFTDTSVCIGCKACEVACKEWNAVPEDGLLMLGSSYDNSGSLGASTWRHVKFIEQPKSLARTPRAWTSARPGRCSAPSSAPSSCRTTSATAAATACRPARSG